VPCSTLGAWVGVCGVQLAPLAEAMRASLLQCTVLHADETPVPMLKPGLGHTHRAYLWSYGSTQFDPSPLVVYDFTESRGGHHARAFLGPWSGKLVCDDFSGYKALARRYRSRMRRARTPQVRGTEGYRTQRSRFRGAAVLWPALRF
jgi:transposase